jgi:uncharacterized protein (DUF58 family)
MSRLGGAFALGLGVTAAALAFGSRPLGVAGVGLLLAAGAARIWAGLARAPVSVVHLPDPALATEGDHVRLRIEVQRQSRMPVGSFVVTGRLGRLGPYECRLQGRGRHAAGELPLGRLPRGRFPVTDSRLVLGDHLGLESVSSPVDSADTSVVVYPRLVELSSLFSDAGRHGGGGRRLLLRRPAGFDFHSVREHEQGESLRRVHWPTTARRGRLMVKELEDPPRDAVVVLLDCDPAGASGDPPDSSFDAAVRAAGSVLQVYASRGRKAALVTTGRDAPAVRVSSLERDFRAALGALAAAEADALHGIARSLGRGHTYATGEGELVVVTATLGPGAVEALLGVALRRLVSVVWIDAPSYARRPTRTVPDLLRLSAAGIAVAVVRRGDDLAAVLDIPRAEALAHG